LEVNIIEKYLSKNDCFKQAQRLVPKGIVVHSTATPGVMATDWFYRWNEPGIKKCVHAFLDNQNIIQHLPWNFRGWHSGGNANNTHIGFEICEPTDLMNKAYFEAVWNKAIQLCTMLCKLFNLTEVNIICHSEGYQMGIASNHADVMHWFPKHNKNMDVFREEVKAALVAEEGDEVRYKTLTDVPKEFQPTMQTLMDAKIIVGDGNGIIDLSHDQIRLLVINYRNGAFDRKLISEGMKPVFEQTYNPAE
jgi:hypothetical protein